MATIGFIGASGLMGHGMAKNLLAKGFPLAFTVHRDRSRIGDLVAAGAKEALASERLTWGEKQDAFRQIWFSAKKAKIARIESGEVARRRVPLPETTEPAHSAD